MPVRMFVTAGTVADCSQACELVEGIEAENLLADKGYDSNDFVDSLKKVKLSLLFLRANAAKFQESMTNIFIDVDTW